MPKPNEKEWKVEITVQSVVTLNVWAETEEEAQEAALRELDLPADSIDRTTRVLN